jgi:hypothetical protein
MDTKILDTKQGAAITADLSQHERHVEVVDLVFCCFFRWGEIGCRCLNDQTANQETLWSAAEKVAIFTGHAPVRGHLYIMGLLNRDPACRFCKMEAETEQHIICCCEALARQYYNEFGKLTVEPKDIRTA